MKVLMFGWEFPPHISGGLGTACHGLTNSLSQAETDVLFVVPKLNGGESADRTSFVNASKIPVSRKNDLHKYIKPTSSENRSVTDIITKIVRQDKHIERLEVPSTLSAYRTPSFEKSEETIAHWNYSIDSRTESVVSIDHVISEESVTRQPASDAEEGDENLFAFSGSYGSQLMEEVRRYAQVAARIARSHDFDVIHAHDWMTYLAGIAAKKVSGKPLVVHVHATEYDRSGASVDPQVHAIECQGLLEADCVVTVSEWTKKITVEKYHIAPEKVCVVHNGIISKEASVKTFDIPPIGSHVVTFFGRITHQKGPLYFVEAARKVLEKIPDAHFVVAGSGDQMPLMIERIAQLRISSHFHFTGFLKGADIDRVWSMSSVYVMPSVSEPFGIAPLEAIQAGVPVVISKQSGVAEVMPHAVKVDFWDSTALAEAICSILKYKGLLRTLSRNGAEEINEISWNKAAKKLTDLYHELTIDQRHA